MKIISITLVLSIVNCILCTLFLFTRPPAIIYRVGAGTPKAALIEAKLAAPSNVEFDSELLPPRVAFRYHLLVMGNILKAREIAKQHPELLLSLDDWPELAFARGARGVVIQESQLETSQNEKQISSD